MQALGSTRQRLGKSEYDIYEKTSQYDVFYGRNYKKVDEN